MSSVTPMFSKNILKFLALDNVVPPPLLLNFPLYPSRVWLNELFTQSLALCLYPGDSSA